MTNRQWIVMGLTVFSLSSTGCTDYKLFSSEHSSPNIKSTQLTEKSISRSAGKPRAAVNIDYSFDGKPANGQPLTVTVQVTPRTSTEQIVVTIQEDSELEWISGKKRVVYTAVEKGSRLESTIVVQPLVDGLAYIHLFTEQSNNGIKQAKVITIPVKTGNAAGSLKHQIPLQTDADGELILSMPAEEKP